MTPIVLSGGLKTLRPCLQGPVVLVIISTMKWPISLSCYFTLSPVPENNDVGFFLCLIPFNSINIH